MSLCWILGRRVIIIFCFHLFFWRTAFYYLIFFHEHLCLYILWLRHYSFSEKKIKTWMITFFIKWFTHEYYEKASGITWIKFFLFQQKEKPHSTTVLQITTDEIRSHNLTCRFLNCRALLRGLCALRPFLRSSA